VHNCIVINFVFILIAMIWQRRDHDCIVIDHSFSFIHHLSSFFHTRTRHSPLFKLDTKFGEFISTLNCAIWNWVFQIVGYVWRDGIYFYSQSIGLNVSYQIWHMILVKSKAQFDTVEIFLFCTSQREFYCSMKFVSRLRSKMLSSRFRHV